VRYRRRPLQPPSSARVQPGCGNDWNPGSPETAARAGIPFPAGAGGAPTRCNERAGWELVTEEPAVAGAGYPGLADLEAAAMTVVEEIGYGRDITDNVRGFARVRIGGDLLRGAASAGTRPAAEIPLPLEMPCLDHLRSLRSPAPHSRLGAGRSPAGGCRRGAPRGRLWCSARRGTAWLPGPAHGELRGRVPAAHPARGGQDGDGQQQPDGGGGCVGDRIGAAEAGCDRLRG
jgi:hypothetical protein